MSRFYNLDEEKRRNPLARLNLPQGYDVTNIRSDMVRKEQPDPMVGRLSAAGVNNPYGNDPVVGSEALIGLGDTSRAYQLAATRGDKRISDTKRRVQELVKLDPTNPLALLVTMLGAREEALTTEELNKLRGIDKKSTRSKLKREKFIKDLKLAGNEKYFEAVVQDEFDGDVDKAINDPKIREKIVAERSKPQKMSPEALSRFAKSFTDLEQTYWAARNLMSEHDADLMGQVVDKLRRQLIREMSDGSPEDNIELMEQAKQKLRQFGGGRGFQDSPEHKQYQLRQKNEELAGLKKKSNPTPREKERIKVLEGEIKKGAGGGLETVEKNLLEGSPGFDPQSEVTTGAGFINKLAKEERLGEAVGNVAEKINAELFGGEKGSLPKGWTREVERINPLPPSPETGLFPVGSERQDIFYHKANNSYVVTRPNGTFSVGILGNDPVKGGFKTPGEAMAFAMTLKADEVAVKKEESLTPVEVDKAVAERNLMEADMLAQEPWRQKDTTDYKDPFAKQSDDRLGSTYVPESDWLKETGDVGSGYVQMTDMHGYLDWINKSPAQKIAAVEGKLDPSIVDYDTLAKFEKAREEARKKLRSRPTSSDIKKTVSELGKNKDAKSEKVLEDILLHIPRQEDKNVLRGIYDMPERHIAGALTPTTDMPGMGTSGYYESDAKVSLLDRGQTKLDSTMDRLDNFLGNIVDEPREGYQQPPIGDLDWLRETSERRPSVDTEMRFEITAPVIDTNIKKQSWNKVVDDAFNIIVPKEKTEGFKSGKPPLSTMTRDDLPVVTGESVSDKSGMYPEPKRVATGESWDTRMGEAVISGTSELASKIGGKAKTSVKSAMKMFASKYRSLFPKEGIALVEGSKKEKKLKKDRRLDDKDVVAVGGPETKSTLRQEELEAMVAGLSKEPHSLMYLARAENEKLDPNAVGYKLKAKRNEHGEKIMKNGRAVLEVAHKMVNGKKVKIPVSYGLMQITVNTASGSDYGSKLFEEEGAVTNEAKIALLNDPIHSISIANEFKNDLKAMLKANKYGSQWSDEDLEIAAITAYNWNGANIVKVLDKTRAGTLDEMIRKYDRMGKEAKKRGEKLFFVPDETKSHIRRYREMRGW